MFELTCAIFERGPVQVIFEKRANRHGAGDCRAIRSAYSATGERFATHKVARVMSDTSYQPFRIVYRTPATRTPPKQLSLHASAAVLCAHGLPGLPAGSPLPIPPRTGFLNRVIA